MACSSKRMKDKGSSTPNTSVKSSIQKVWLSPFSYPLPCYRLAKASAAMLCCFSVFMSFIEVAISKYSC